MALSGIFVLFCIISLGSQTYKSALPRCPAQCGHFGSGTSRATAEPGETFSRDPAGEIKNFFFILHILVYFIFLSDGALPLPNVAGPGVTTLLLLSRRACFSLKADSRPRLGSTLSAVDAGGILRSAIILVHAASDTVKRFWT